MKISLLCPTRYRPTAMRRLWESAKHMADDPKRLEIVFYIDNDDVHSVHKFEEMDCEQVKGILGERIVLSQMWNECYKEATGDIFMHCGDDIVFRTQGWDTLVCEHINKYPDKIVFVHGMDGIQNEKLGTHGFLHRNWVDAIGYFVPPYFSCDYNDTWLTDVSDMLGRRAYEPRIFTEHMHWAVGKQPKDSTYSETQARGHRDNVTALYESLRTKRLEDVEKLKKYIEEYKLKNVDQVI